jgi:hypothetical protein
MTGDKFDVNVTEMLHCVTVVTIRQNVMSCPLIGAGSELTKDLLVVIFNDH